MVLTVNGLLGVMQWWQVTIAMMVDTGMSIALGSRPHFVTLSPLPK